MSINDKIDFKIFKLRYEFIIKMYNFYLYFIIEQVLFKKYIKIEGF